MATRASSKKTETPVELVLVQLLRRGRGQGAQLRVEEGLAEGGDRHVAHPHEKHAQRLLRLLSGAPRHLGET